MQIKVTDRDSGNPVAGVSFTVTTPSGYSYTIGPSDSSGIASGTVDLYEVQLHSGSGVGFDTVAGMVKIEATSFPEGYDAAAFKLNMQNQELYGYAEDQLYSGDGSPHLEVNAGSLFPYFGADSGGWDEGWNYDTMQTGTSFDTIGVQKVPDSGINYNVFVPLSFEVFKMPDVEYAGFKLTKVVESGTIPVPGAEYRLRLRYTGTVTLADGTQVKRTSDMYSTGTTDGFAPGTYTTDENGVLEIPKIFPISDTWWSIYEVKVPEGMADPRGSVDYSEYKYSIQFLESNLNSDGIYEYTYRNNRLTGMTGVSKVLVGDGGVDMSVYANEEFTFKVRLWTEVDGQEVPVSGTFHYGSRPIRAREDADVWRTSEATTYPTLTFDENGEATVTTKPGYDHSIYIYDVPEGTLSSVEELPKDGWISLGPWPTSPDYVNHNDVYARDAFNVAKAQAKVDVEATKQLIGAELSAEQFSFELKDAQGKVLATAANAADGKVVFEGVDLPLDALEPTKITYAEATDEQKEQATLWIGHEGWGPNYLYTDDIPDEAHAYFDGYVTHAEATDEQKETPGKQWAIGSVYYYDSRYTTVHDTAVTYLYDDELTLTISEVVPEGANPAMAYDTHGETVKVKVVGSEGSTVSTEVSYDSDGALFENELTGLTDVMVTKVWDDSDNVDGVRPDSITVNLLADGEQVESVELNEAGGWAYAWVDLPLRSGGKEIAYTMEEVVPQGYTASIEQLPATDTSADPASAVGEETDNPKIEELDTPVSQNPLVEFEITNTYVPEEPTEEPGDKPTPVKPAKKKSTIPNTGDPMLTGLAGALAVGGASLLAAARSKRRGR